jgi:hypothetical protein
MTLIQFVMVGFVVLELSNIVMLYFAPGSTIGNAAGIFTAWEKSKQYPEIHEFIKYLVYWVAGSKLIFILLLTVIILYADAQTQRICALVMALAIATFYWRLFPIIRKLDLGGQIAPKNFSMVLAGMIFLMIAMFLISFLV